MQLAGLPETPGLMGQIRKKRQLASPMGAPNNPFAFALQGTPTPIPSTPMNNAPKTTILDSNSGMISPPPNLAVPMAPQGMPQNGLMGAPTMTPPMTQPMAQPMTQPMAMPQVPTMPPSAMGQPMMGLPNTQALLGAMPNNAALANPTALPTAAARAGQAFPQPAAMGAVNPMMQGDFMRQLLQRLNLGQFAGRYF